MDPSRAFMRGALGAFPGAMIGLMALNIALRGAPPIHGIPWRLVALGGGLGACLGAAIGVYAGAFEIHGMARPVLLGCTSGILIGIVLGGIASNWVHPVYESRSVFAGALGGGVLGAVVGRLQYRRRITLAEMMVAVAIAAPLCALLAVILKF